MMTPHEADRLATYAAENLDPATVEGWAWRTRQGVAAEQNHNRYLPIAAFHPTALDLARRAFAGWLVEQFTLARMVTPAAEPFVVLGEAVPRSST